MNADKDSGICVHRRESAVRESAHGMRSALTSHPEIIYGNRSTFCVRIHDALSGVQITVVDQFAENSPAIYGWEQAGKQIESREGQERNALQNNFFRP